MCWRGLWPPIWAWGDRDTTHTTAVVCGARDCTLSTGSVLGRVSGPIKVESWCISSPSSCLFCFRSILPISEPSWGVTAPVFGPLKHPIVPMCPTAEQTKGLGLLVAFPPACKADTVTPLPTGLGGEGCRESLSDDSEPGQFWWRNCSCESSAI